MGNWLWYHLGINGTGPWYAFWSGIGSDAGELTLLGAILELYRRHTCHVTHCWRPSLHPVEGTPYRVCRRHHPDVPSRVTFEHIKELHHARSAGKC